MILNSKCLFFIFSVVFLIPLHAQNPKEVADRLFANGNYTKAIEAYKAVKNLDQVYSKIAKAYVAIGNYDNALTNYKNAVLANPNATVLHYEYAKLLTKTKKYKAAKPLFKNLIRLDSFNPNYHYELGIVLEKQKDTTALQHFKKVFNLDNTHQKAIFKIAKQCIKKRQFKLAHTYIAKGLESYANNIKLISLKAQAYYYQAYYTDAILWFNKLIDLGENTEFIHEKLSLSYAQNSDYKAAILHRKLALKYNPYDANAIFVIGKYYQELKDFEKAEAYITKALKLKDVSLTDEYQQLGIILNRQKKYKAAIKAFQKSLKEEATNLLSEFFLLRTKDEFYADLDTKIKMYQAYVNNKKDSPFAKYAQQRLKELKQEKFLEGQ
ncbi:MAG: tetratricopeptide repeat protein [Winogradskyella sp.]